MSDFKQELVISHADGAVYGKAGIRDQFVYRHFGVPTGWSGSNASARTVSPPSRMAGGA